MRVIGTAGHVDHGKSTLVHALSGIDPDRLKEEKRRGMTIDLGFAWITLPSAPADGSVENVGIVDVPGHIDFIKNMLAGVGGIDAALLVIAADEGVMPQTREHLAILDLLAVPAAVVALTKSDLAPEPEWLDLVELDIADLLATTHLTGSPIVRVSAVTSAGLDDLRQTLAKVLSQLPPRRNRGRPRLPVDRIFSLSGFGTVVTGTLLDGQFAVGDAIEVLPDRLPARIRGLQTHRQQVQVGEPGSRLAINLSGVSTEQLYRGDVVAKPGALQPTTLLDVYFRLLPDAAKPLKHNQLVDFFVGSAEVRAHVRLLGVEVLEPGAEGFLQLRLDVPAVVAAGDRYILRQPSPSATLGGGLVLSPHPRRRWRRFDAAVLARLETLARGAPDEILLQTLARQPLSTAADLIAASELDLNEARAALQELRAQRALTELGSEDEPVLLTLETWGRLLDALNVLLADFHRSFPLRKGMPRGEVRSRLQAQLPGANLSVRSFNALLAECTAAGVAHADDSYVWQTGFVPQPTPAQQQAVDRLLNAYARAPYSPPNLQESMGLLGGDAELLNFLVEQRRLTRLGGDVLLRGDDYDAMVAAIINHLESHNTVTLAEVRDLFHTSRKYAQALLEEMDARRITRREGDVRLLWGQRVG
ncbi:MAG: selenocysteine-specific translation elongation factor [Caldilineaceae bacterium]|nr:selenocysteine-specific translation elongation factor [Caldilineaceae bacterium]